MFLHDEYEMRCSNNKCKNSYSVRNCSTFSDSKIGLDTLMLLLMHFVADSTVHSKSILLDLNRETVIHFYNKCREVIEGTLIMDPIKFTSIYLNPCLDILEET